MYRIEYSEKAKADIVKLKRNIPSAFPKLLRLIEELIEHPTFGTGKPHRLTGDRAGQWSRKITDKHRLVYTITKTTVTVLVLTAYGHYGDK